MDCWTALSIFNWVGAIDTKSEETNRRQFKSD